MKKSIETVLKIRLKELAYYVDQFTRFGAIERREHDDEIETFACCHKRTIDEHAPDCDWVKMVRSKEQAEAVLKVLK